MKKPLVFCLLAFVIILPFQLVAATKNLLPIIPEKGVYDGKIGEQTLILIAQESTPTTQTGFYVLNQGKAVEETHSYQLEIRGKKIYFRSDSYSGTLKADLTANAINGKIALDHQKRKFLFWKPKAIITFNKREEKVPQPNERYQKEIFKEVVLKKDIKYGAAPGYWTSNPVDDQPYIEVLMRGINYTYKETDSLDLKLDLYRPNTDTFMLRPVILLIHGGAFYIGSKKCPTSRQLAVTLAKRGYVVASIDYRLGFKLNARDVDRSGYRALQDAHAAARFLANRAKEYGIDPNQMYVAGNSAGAIASLNLAFMDNDERPESVVNVKKSEDLGKIETSGNSLKDKFQIKAVGNLWGAVNDVAIIDPDEQIPVLSVHGTADDIVPYNYDYPFQKAYLVNRLVMNKMYGSSPIHDRLNQLKIPNQLISLKGLKHEPQYDLQENFNSIMDTIMVNLPRFFYEQTAPKIASPEKQYTLVRNAGLQPFYVEVSNGNLNYAEATGGIKTSSNPTNLSFIWFKNSDVKKLTLYTKNQYEAWNVKEFRVTLK
jgi:dipeptidyl aminopeptidase/acylaminoacyl peptidase